MSYLTKNELNLKGRKPDELPDELTINDILLELKDTGSFQINFERINNSNWQANNEHFSNYIEMGQVSIFEANWKPELSRDSFTQTNVSIIEKRWNINRYPVRLKVVYKGIVGDYKQDPNLKGICQLSNDVFLRLKDYIGIDIIQSQFLYTNFMIDFVNSDCQLVK